MSRDFLDRISKLSPKRLALLALELHEQVEAASQRGREAIAVIGMACRFPGGADHPEAFWTLLRDGRDAIREVPPDRWDIDAYFDPDPDVPAKMSARAGGFLDCVDGFDPAFFGISPREALTMDPQQRLMLEVAWEALEHAGLSPERLAGSATGVYIGVCNSDHFHRVMQRGTDTIDSYLASGNAPSVVSGRVSYFLGLRGPALSVDTACSSSLVALHLACKSLRDGETRVALSGGVNVMCSPETTVALSKAHMLASDGRCKTFDASADGFSRGEGCGVLVLKRLSDAQSDGDRVLALIRGTAANQDGRSGGLTVPNGQAQEAVIRAALADAKLQPADIDYVEAHGTGTTLGDPIEVRALGGALGAGRSAGDPLLIGSVKTNIGHLESAAGVAGVIKVVLSLQHERIPPHLHFSQPSPHIPWADSPVKVEAQGRAWPRGTKPRIAGVSSFGFSGTNAHVIIEEAPPTSAPARKVTRPLHCLPLSARSEAALRELAQRYAAALAPGCGLTLEDAAHTAGVGRSHFSERLAVVADNEATARSALTAFVQGRDHPAVYLGTADPGHVPEVVFLYTGQGAQYPGMSQALYERSPVFREIIDRCDAFLGADERGRTLKTVLQAGPAENAPVHETSWTQPALFAVEYALTQLWRSWGIEPAAVIGHSVGEYVAACVAGVFPLEDGLRLIQERGRLMQALPPGGSMAALFAPEGEVRAAIGQMADRLAIAAINAPDSVVVSGDSAAVDTLLVKFAARNVRGHRLFVSLAAHSPLVVPALDAMEACARKVTMHAPRIPIAWNVSGGARLPSGVALDAVYWRRHLREPVRFADGIASLYRDGYRTFLEVGPHPTLIALAQRSLPEEGVHLATSLRRAKDDWQELTNSLASLYVHGARVDWAGVDRPYGFARVTLPSYPFERRSFWITPPAAGMHRPAPVPRGMHPLVGARLSTAVPIFETMLTPQRPAYIGDHRIQGTALVAGPVYLEMAQACGRELRGPANRAVEQFAIREPLVLAEAGRVVQLHFAPEQDGALPFSVYSRAVDGAGEWQLHATGRLVSAGKPITAQGVNVPLERIAQSLGMASPCDAYYEKLAGLGIQLGASFRSLMHARRKDCEVLASLALPQPCAVGAVCWAEPGLLDGALQAVGMCLPQPDDGSEVYLLTGIDRAELTGPLPRQFKCHARLLAAGEPKPAQWRADVTLRANEGDVLGEIRGVTLRRATRDTLARAVRSGSGNDLFYHVSWEPAPVAVRASPWLELPAAFMPRVRDCFGSLAVEHGVSVYEKLMPELDRLSVEHLAVALRRLGFDATPGRVFSLAAEAASLRIAPRHTRLFARLLEMLAEEGLLRPRDHGFEITGALPTTDPMSRYDALVRRFGEVDGEASTLRRCGPELARVLTGEQDPLQLLFPGGSFAEARKLYVESPYARAYNGALADAVEFAIAKLPPTSRLRILEIGAGTGGTTTYVLPRLPADRVEYAFTDLSPLFLDRAAEQFKDYLFVRYALLDIERDPQNQGFQVGHYDLVIAANVLHATADLKQSLSHARSLMASGGLLLLLEGVAPERWVDLTFGLTDGWWRFVDTDLRPNYPLISSDAWHGVLAQLGFSGVASLPNADKSVRGVGQQALIVARAPVVPRRWTLVGGPECVSQSLAQRLTRRGEFVVALPSGLNDAAPIPADEWVYLGALEIGDPGDDATRCEVLACEEPLRWLSRIAKDEAAGRAWFITQGAQSVGDRTSANARWQVPLWGVGRVFSLECPSRFGGLIDLDDDSTGEALVDSLLAALDAEDGEDQTAWRTGSRLACRLTRAPAPDAPAISLRADATYLVTGGFGGLGLLVAKWMAERGARHIALLGRHPEMQSDGVHAIQALGVEVIPIRGDVAAEGAMRAALAELAAIAPPLRGIVHAAAAFSAAPITELTCEQARAMLRPKIEGTVVLERLTLGVELDFIVLFSSTTALLGASGFAHYAAANLFLDATAQAADQKTRRVLSVNWGTWEVMRLASAKSQRGYREGGFEPIATTEALDALGGLLAGRDPQAVVAKIDWSILKPLHEARRARPFLSRLTAVPAVERTAHAASVAAPGLLELIASASQAMREEMLSEFVSGEVAAVLGLDASQPVPVEKGFFDMGMDSLMSVELKRRLERGVGRKLPSTLTFNYPNAAALAAFLARELQVASVPSDSPTPASAALPPTENDELSALSDEELEARLLARLEQTE